MKLSVAMITYNHERFIAQAIESALRQSVNFPYEIVIGDDCSTDSTPAIIADFHRRYPERIVPFLRDKNIGGPQNLSAILQACRGSYIAFLEGDDYWTDEHKLQRQVDFLDTHPECSLCCHRVRLVGTNDAESRLYPTRSAGTLSIEDLLHENFVATGSVLLRRGAIGTLPDWYFKIRAGDWVRWALVAEHGHIELMDDVMAAYRVHAGGTWSSRSYIQQRREIIQLLTALDGELGFRYSLIIRRTAARLALDLALTARNDRNRWEIARAVALCLRNGGLRLTGERRTLAALAAYSLLGSSYKLISRLKIAIPD